jgi:predicted enzyme related to lactoylglutathione lyase
MRRVTGIGGIFFKEKNPVALRAWYQTHLGIDVQQWGGTTFEWADAGIDPNKGTTIWTIVRKESDQLEPSSAPFMINYRVENLTMMLNALKQEGCNVLAKTDDSEYGKFGWVIDPEGNKVELWQPPESS